ncbi:unnamed protein product [Triticum turgidum subsp. durum]|uniref:Uncharacterized protein n=1 Tax=Triticum turgidum subsp. durum TaxID=4567 RepID=A0A9R1RDZ4_TRITD|nr:unnamed protein product [Triticum turgidum subsp. durum]
MPPPTPPSPSCLLSLLPPTLSRSMPMSACTPPAPSVPEVGDTSSVSIFDAEAPPPAISPYRISSGADTGKYVTGIVRPLIQQWLSCSSAGAHQLHLLPMDALHVRLIRV